MDAENRKLCWWLALGCSAGVPLCTLPKFFAMLFRVAGLTALDPWVIWPLANAVVAANSIFQLCRLYAANPTWTGKWQVSLVELVAVVFFAACIMAVLRATDPVHFIPAGIVVSFCTVAGYLVALLFQCRIGYWDRSSRWFIALLLFLASVAVVLVGIFVQTIVIMPLTGLHF